MKSNHNFPLISNLIYIRFDVYYQWFGKLMFFPSDGGNRGYAISYCISRFGKAGTGFQSPELATFC